MTLLKFTQFAHTPSKLSRPQRGEVVDNNDPKKLGRVKCSIPKLIEGSNDVLPWIYPKNPYAHGGNAKSASLHIPRIGSFLIVEFPHGMAYHGFYTGYWHHANNYAMDKFTQNYPNRFGHQDPTGNYLVHDKTDHTVEYGHLAQDDDQSQDDENDSSEDASGSGTFTNPRKPLKDSSSTLPKIYFKIDKEGTLLINSLKNMTTAFNGDTSHSTGGNHTHQTQGNHSLITQLEHTVQAVGKMVMSSSATATIQAAENALVKGSKIFLN